MSLWLHRCKSEIEEEKPRSVEPPDVATIFSFYLLPLSFIYSFSLFVRLLSSSSGSSLTVQRSVRLTLNAVNAALDDWKVSRIVHWLFKHRYQETEGSGGDC